MRDGDPMEAELKQVSWAEPTPLDQYQPDPTKPFSVEVTLHIGPKDGRGVDLFYVDVSNPAFLSVQLNAEGARLLQHTILVDDFLITDVERIVRDFCRTCTGETWHEVALLLMRLGRWEYEGILTP
jgi:hypothetical protein